MKNLRLTSKEKSQRLLDLLLRMESENLYYGVRLMTDTLGELQLSPSRYLKVLVDEGILESILTKHVPDELLNLGGIGSYKCYHYINVVKPNIKLTDRLIHQVKVLEDKYSETKRNKRAINKLESINFSDKEITSKLIELLTGGLNNATNGATVNINISFELKPRLHEIK